MKLLLNDGLINFDTILYIRILGKKAFGLSSLLQDYFSIHVNKEFQKANW